MHKTIVAVIIVILGLILSGCSHSSDINPATGREKVNVNEVIFTWDLRESVENMARANICKLEVPKAAYYGATMIAVKERVNPQSDDYKELIRFYVMKQIMEPIPCDKVQANLDDYVLRVKLAKPVGKGQSLD